MQHLTHIELLPVLQLTPFDFGESLYPFSEQVSEEVLYQYRKKVLVDNGFNHLDYLNKKFTYLAINHIDDWSLQKLLAWFLKDDYQFNWVNKQLKLEKTRLPKEELPFSFPGGVILTSNGDPIITPQCCISLQDHQEWYPLSSSESFTLIWIGHPWIYYKIIGDTIVFTRLIEKEMHSSSWRHYNTADNTVLMDASNFLEKEQKDIKEEDIKYSINFDEFKLASEKLKLQLKDFEIRIREILQAAGLDNASDVANCLVNGNGEHFSYAPEDIE